MLAGFCRDCLAAFPQPVPSRCRECGSPRIVAHPELGDLAIAHVDCDAFYASIEKRDDPTLCDKAVIIGGSQRGVVLTACYTARIKGVRSAMPMFQALRLCPEATIVRPNMSKYAEAGRAIRTMMQAITPRVQPLSIDEAFLDLSGTEMLHGTPPAITLGRFAQSVEATLGVSVSVGLSYCKYLAKIASDTNKPRGFTVIGRQDAKAVLRPRPVSAISGVGRVTQERLAQRGFITIGDIQDCSEAEFARRTGSQQSSLWHLAHGIDRRIVTNERDRKGISNETTFRGNLSTADELLPILYGLCEKVAKRLVAEGVGAGNVVLKLKTDRFRLKTRSRSPIPSTQLAARLYDYGRDLLAGELDGTNYRLIGIGVSDLQPAAAADQADLLDAALPRQKAAAQAIDHVRAKFGDDALMRGITLRKRPER